MCRGSSETIQQQQHHQHHQPAQHLPSMTALAAATAAAAALAPHIAHKRSASQTSDSKDNDSDGGSAAAQERAKRRRSRWGGEEKEKMFIPGMPTVLPANLTKEQEQAYLGVYSWLKWKPFCRSRLTCWSVSVSSVFFYVFSYMTSFFRWRCRVELIFDPSTVQFKIEEITRKLRTGDLGIPANPEERSAITKWY